MNKSQKELYNEHCQTRSETDFWGQVKRTVNGVPVSQEQIDMIVSAIRKNLCLCENDLLLDLCCGNGALSTLLFQYCKGGVGIDISDSLITIAKKYFEKQAKETFYVQDVVDFCRTSKQTDQFTKALCYGAFSYLSFNDAYELLENISQNFKNLQKVFIGNCPDKKLIHKFDTKRLISKNMAHDPSSQIGIWRTTNEFRELAKLCNWKIKIHRMPEKYYAAYYRYDVILSR